ncbi:MAG: hypothetical protein EPGJADBJ_00554 [Saprospiraceae bacterium]|nr:hypothetical protein [Saprospiraceae bacterium]
MKRIFLLSEKAALLCFCFFFITLVANAQTGTEDDGFTVRITSPASIAQDISYGYLDCGWLGTAGFGPDVTEDTCGVVVWAMPDSLGCAPLPAGSLDGKIALIRRGNCGFSLKIYHAQQAGAKAAIILNHYTNPLDGPCEARINDTQYFGGMSGLDSASAVNIPAIFLQRQTGEAIDGALQAGETVEVCFIFPRMQNQTAVYHYATPLSQVDTIGTGIMSVLFTNRSDNTLTDAVVKADIESPTGNITTLSVTIPSLDPDSSQTVDFEEFVPEQVVGKFKVTFSNSVFTESRDTLVTYFEHTDYTFATDNLVVDPLGVGVSNSDFITGNFIHQSAGLCVTGDNGGLATYVTFGLANVDTVWSSLGDDANTVSIIVYDADANEDGFLDIENNFDDLQGQEIGFGTYIMSGNEPVDSLFSVAVFDANDPSFPVPLKPNHAYYVSLFYDGTNAGTGRCLRYSNTLDVPYAINLTTPLAVGSPTGLGFFSGYNGAKIIHRLQLQGFDPLNAKEQKPLDVAKYKVTPNPATDVVRLDLKLAEVNKSVTVSLIDWNGRIARSQTVKEFQNGQLTFQVNDLPSGYYLAWIRTSEGAAIAKVAICH